MFNPINKSLEALFSDLYAPCPGFMGPCKGMRCQPENGHVPRGFYGATGDLNEVELVLVFAEPGDPSVGDRYNSINETTRHTYSAFFERGGQFHSNVKYILNGCFPGESIEVAMNKTWMTESVLCSASYTTGPIEKGVVNECGNRYLIKQIALMPNALIVALGSKSQSRLMSLGVKFISAFAVGKPGCNRVEARPSWDNVISEVNRRRVDKSDNKNRSDSLIPVKEALVNYNQKSVENVPVTIKETVRLSVAQVELSELVKMGITQPLSYRWVTAPAVFLAGGDRSLAIKTLNLWKNSNQIPISKFNEYVSQIEKMKTWLKGKNVI